MSVKRFAINGKEIIQDKQVWCMAHSEHCADVIATAMNELHEENKKLKQVNEMLQMDSVMTERNLIEENEQLKEKIKQLKDLIHTILKTIDVENINSDDTIYSARIVFSRKEFKLIREIYNEVN